jgi:hypothetical protein
MEKMIKFLVNFRNFQKFAQRKQFSQSGHPGRMQRRTGESEACKNKANFLPGVPDGICAYQK